MFSGLGHHEGKITSWYVIKQLWWGNVSGNLVYEIQGNLPSYQSIIEFINPYPATIFLSLKWCLLFLSSELQTRFFHRSKQYFNAFAFVNPILHFSDWIT